MNTVETQENLDEMTKLAGIEVNVFSSNTILNTRALIAKWGRVGKVVKNVTKLEAASWK